MVRVIAVGKVVRGRVIFTKVEKEVVSYGR